ncbi:MAG: hypothetical protein JJ896_14460 [Rhodothermales bacterium]|nr:hypothetical protein [Rhodothermales bacterium]MBO6780853.1 hypothetical protein [Rhodothermales bacterium]
MKSKKVLIGCAIVLVALLGADAMDPGGSQVDDLYLKAHRFVYPDHVPVRQVDGSVTWRHRDHFVNSADHFLQLVEEKRFHAVHAYAKLVLEERPREADSLASLYIAREDARMMAVAGPLPHESAAEHADRVRRGRSALGFEGDIGP